MMLYGIEEGIFYTNWGNVSNKLFTTKKKLNEYMKRVTNFGFTKVQEDYYESRKNFYGYKIITFEVVE